MKSVQVKTLKPSAIYNEQPFNIQKYSADMKDNYEMHQEEEDQEKSNNSIMITNKLNESQDKKINNQEGLNKQQQRLSIHRIKTATSTQHIHFATQEDTQVKSRRPPSQLNYILNHPSNNIRDMYARLYTRTTKSSSNCSDTQGNQHKQQKQDSYNKLNASSEIVQNKKNTIQDMQILKDRSKTINSKDKINEKNELRTEIGSNKTGFMIQLSQSSTPQNYSGGVDSMKNKFRVFSEYSSQNNKLNSRLAIPSYYSAVQSCMVSAPPTPICSKANLVQINKFQISNSNNTNSNQELHNTIQATIIKQKIQREVMQKELFQCLEKPKNYDTSFEQIQQSIDDKFNSQQTKKDQETEPYESSQQQVDNQDNKIVHDQIMADSCLSQDKTVFNQGQNEKPRIDEVNPYTQSKLFQGSTITSYSLLKKQTYSNFTVGKLQNMSSGNFNRFKTANILQELDKDKDLIKNEKNKNDDQRLVVTDCQEEQESQLMYSKNCFLSQESQSPFKTETFLLTQQEKQEPNYSNNHINHDLSPFNSRKMSCYSEKYRAQRELLMKNFLDSNNNNNNKNILNECKNHPQLGATQIDPNIQPVSFLKRHFSVGGEFQFSRKISEKGKPISAVKTATKHTEDTETDQDGYINSQQMKQVYKVNNMKLFYTTGSLIKKNNSNKQTDCYELANNSKPKNNNLKPAMKLEVIDGKSSSSIHQFSGFWNGCVPSSPWEVDVEKGLIELTDSQTEQMKLMKTEEMELSRRRITLENVIGQVVSEQEKIMNEKNFNERSKSQGNNLLRIKEKELEKPRRISSSQNLRSLPISVSQYPQDNFHVQRKVFQVQTTKLCSSPQREESPQSKQEILKVQSYQYQNPQPSPLKQRAISSYSQVATLQQILLQKQTLKKPQNPNQQLQYHHKQLQSMNSSNYKDDHLREEANNNPGKIKNQPVGLSLSNTATTTIFFNNLKSDQK